MRQKPSIDRRSFLKGSGLALGTGVLSTSASQGIYASKSTIPTATPGKAKLGIIGVGGRGLEHVRVADLLPDQCEILAICDVREDALAGARKALQNSSPKPYREYKEMLEHPGLTAVIVSTPNYLHRDMVVDALDHGAHVLTEKPMATTAKDCDAMIDAMYRNNRVLSVCMQSRFFGKYIRLREVIHKEKTIGTVKFLSSRNFRNDWKWLDEDPAINRRINWRYYQDLSGGSLIEKCCHDFDLYNMLLDSRAVKVTGSGGTNRWGSRETLDHASVSIEYDNGVRANHDLCLFTPRKAHQLSDNYTIIGDKGMIYAPKTSDEATILVGPGTGYGNYPLAKETKVKDYPMADQKGIGHKGTYEVHVDFLAAMREGRPAMVDATMGREAIRIAQAGEISIAEERTVYLRELS